jgi:hypothetical protein
MDSPIFLILIAAISVAIGYFASSLFGGRRAGKEDGAAPGGEPIPNPLASAEAALSAPSAPPAPAPAKNRLEMVTFWREPPAGALHADLDGKTFKKGDELSPEQRRRLALVSNDLRPWLTPPPAPTPAAVPASTPRLADFPPLPVIQPAVDTRPAAEKSIVAQIDDIFQEHIANTPLVDRNIRLVELPGHEVAVKVGPVQYPGIEEVPDAEIVAALRAAVKTWENRAG